MKFRPARRAFVVGSLLALIAGCASVGPDYERPATPLQPAWLAEERLELDTSAAELADWWTRLDDPVLDELIRKAIAENNNIRIAGLRVLEAQARLGIAVGNRYPQTQVLLGDLTASGISDSTGDIGDSEFIESNLAASVAWEVDFWGKFRRGIEAADANLLGSIENYNDVLILVTAQVADAYARLRSAEEQLELARNSVEIQQRSYDIVEVLYRNGQNSELDSLQAKTQLLGTQATIPNLEQTIRQTKNAIAVLLGTAPTDLEPLLGEQGRLPDIPAELAVGIPADLLRQRPDVRQAELRAIAQNANVGVATANLYPSFSLNGLIGLSASGNNNDGSGDLFSTESLGYSAGASFVWPFFNYGRIRNNIRVQDARLQQELVRYRETVIQAAREVEDALVALEGTAAQDAILAEGVATAKRSADLSILRYQEGFADYQRVLNAQQALFTQQQRYASNRGAVMRSLVAVYRSLGGGWQSARPENYVSDDDREQMEERTNWGDLIETLPQPRNE